MRLFLIVLTLFASVPSYAGSETPSPPEKRLSEKEKRLQIQGIEIIEGVPKRPYQQIQPVMAQARSLEAALKKLRKEAYKLGADAVIRFEAGSSVSQQAMYTQLTGFFTYNKNTVTAQGWAVRWK